MADDGAAFPIEHERMLATLLDVVVPPSEDGRLPGAGALGLTDHVLRTVGQTPMLGPVVAYGLSALADLAATRNGGGWTGCRPTSVRTSCASSPRATSSSCRRSCSWPTPDTTSTLA